MCEDGIGGGGARQAERRSRRHRPPTLRYSRPYGLGLWAGAVWGRRLDFVHFGADGVEQAVGADLGEGIAGTAQLIGEALSQALVEGDMLHIDGDGADFGFVDFARD